MEATLAIIAAVTALGAVILGPLVSLWAAKKQANVSVLSANRQAWINALRDCMAEYFATANYIHATDWSEHPLSEHHEKMARLAFLNSKIRLMLNPDEDDHKALVRALGEFALLCSSAPKKKDKPAWHRHHDDSMTLTQSILKREWQRVKNVE